MNDRLFACVFLSVVTAVASTITVVAVALLATDPDRYMAAVAVLPGSVLVTVVAGLGLLATRRGAR